MPREPIRRQRSTPCSALGQAENDELDMCKLQYGHEGPHHGKYTGMKWTEKVRRSRPDAHRLVGQPSPIHALPPQSGEA